MTKHVNKKIEVLIMDVDILRQFNILINNKQFMLESKIDLIKDIIERYNLKTRCRKREFIYNRYVLFYYLRKYDYPFQIIANMFNINHATVFNGINVYKDLVATNDYEFHLITEDIRIELDQIDKRRC